MVLRSTPVGVERKEDGVEGDVGMYPQQRPRLTPWEVLELRRLCRTGLQRGGRGPSLYKLELTSYWPRTPPEERGGSPQ